MILQSAAADAVALISLSCQMVLGTQSALESLILISPKWKLLRLALFDASVNLWHDLKEMMVLSSQKRQESCENIISHASHVASSTIC